MTPEEQVINARVPVVEPSAPEIPSQIELQLASTRNRAYIAGYEQALKDISLAHLNLAAGIAETKKAILG